MSKSTGKTIRKTINEIKKLSVGRKIQLVAALLVTIALIIALPTIAWFGYKREIFKLQKVDSPNKLYLSAAHREDSMNFLIDGINADEFELDAYGNKVKDNQGNDKKITHKDYVFCVTGESVDEFMIQLAYTTNNPFSYEVYAAKELGERPAGISGTEKDYLEYVVTGVGVDGMPVVVGPEYHTDAPVGSYLFYKIDPTVTADGAVNGKYAGTYLNRISGSGTVGEDADQSYHEKTYGGYNKVHHDAEPIYWQATRLKAFPGETNANKKPFSRHFIIRVKWEAGELNNTEKETDIVYITVKATK